METICILEAKDHLSASSAKALLESNNIICLFPNEHFTGIMPHYGFTTGGFKIYVSVNDRDRANELLNDYREDFLYSNIGKKMLTSEVCPSCGDSNVVLDRSYKLWIALFGALFSIPFPAKKTVNHCLTCDHRWK